MKTKLKKKEYPQPFRVHRSFDVDVLIQEAMLRTTDPIILNRGHGWQTRLFEEVFKHYNEVKPQVVKIGRDA